MHFFIVVAMSQFFFVLLLYGALRALNNYHQNRGNNKFISIVCLILGWFGMRKDFCEFLLDAFPPLREYGNVSYKFSDSIVSDANTSSDSSIDFIPTDSQRRKEAQKVVGSVLIIDVPD